MIGFITLIGVSVMLLVFTALNLKNILLHGQTSAYGHVYTYGESPVAFVISVVGTLLAFAFGLVLALTGLATIFGLTR